LVLVMFFVEVYQMNLLIVKRGKTFGPMLPFHTQTQIKEVLLHIDYKSVFLAEPAHHIDRKIMFLHFALLLQYMLVASVAGMKQLVVLPGIDQA
jgi:hypothetical protein